MEEARRRVIKDAMDSIWWQVDFNDGCVLLNMLYPIWQLIRSFDDTPDNLPDFLCWFIEDIYRKDFLDSKGRRTKLSFAWTVELFDLPSIIEWLPKLNWVDDVHLPRKSAICHRSKNLTCLNVKLNSSINLY
jgi:hypothetical protein